MTISISGPGADSRLCAHGIRARGERLALAGVFLLALGLRAWFVIAGSVENALRRSDTLDYLQYALNLVLYHTFSHSHIAEGPIVADSFRDPGYPWFLAALLWPLDFTDAWYGAVLGTQALLGALTACLAMRIARRWLRPGLSLGVGLLTAVWPHSVAFTGFVLSETLFSFLLALAVWLLCRASEARGTRSWFAAGLGFGAAALVNATVTPVAPLLAWLLWRRRMLAPLLALALAGGSLLPSAAWALRGWAVAGGQPAGARAAINFVQGSWPEYHQAYLGSLGQEPAAQATVSAIGREQDLILQSPRAGAAAIWARMRAEPWRYLGWYAWKPVLLWGWSIRMGWGDIYAYPVMHSIYLTNPVMPAVEALCFALNPLLALLMVLALLAVLLRPPLAATRPGLLALVVLVGCETLVYTLLQSEPRYSVPLRPFQMILALTAVQGLLSLWQERMRQRRPATAAPAPHPPVSSAPEEKSTPRGPL